MKLKSSEFEKLNIDYDDRPDNDGLVEINKPPKKEKPVTSINNQPQPQKNKSKKKKWVYIVAGILSGLGLLTVGGAIGYAITNAVVANSSSPVVEKINYSLDWVGDSETNLNLIDDNNSIIEFVIKDQDNNVVIIDPESVNTNIDFITGSNLFASGVDLNNYLQVDFNTGGNGINQITWTRHGLADYKTDVAALLNWDGFTNLRDIESCMITFDFNDPLINDVIGYFNISLLFSAP